MTLRIMFAKQWMYHVHRIIVIPKSPTAVESSERIFPGLAYVNIWEISASVVYMYMHFNSFNKRVNRLPTTWNISVIYICINLSQTEWWLESRESPEVGRVTIWKHIISFYILIRDLALCYYFQVKLQPPYSGFLVTYLHLKVNNRMHI